jgi:hypothetical protein
MADADAPEVYWLIQQAIAWALTRDLEFVEQIAGSSDPGSLALTTEIALRQVKLKARGRDIKQELLDASGGSSRWPDGFDIRQHFENLLRAGRLRSVGTRPGETESRALSPADWNNLELSHVVLTEHGSARDLLRQQQLLANGSLPPWRRGLSEDRSLEFPGLNPPSVLVARPIARRGVPQSSPDPFLIQISKADALREFPAEPPVPGLLSDDELDAIIGMEEKKRGKRLTRNGGPKIVKEILKDTYPQLTEMRIRGRIIALHPDATSGPQGPRKNRGA